MPMIAARYGIAMRSARALYATALLGVFLSGISCVLSAQPLRENTLTPITDQIYRGSNGVWHSLVYVGETGILLVDTLNPGYADWLAQTLEERFPGKPVQYVIYTHSHWDHAEGGKVFADTATFVAHETMLTNMDGRYPHMPGDIIDRNSNGAFEPEEFSIPWDEAPGVCGASFLQARDANADGHLSPAEYFAEIVPPDLVYAERMTLNFDGQDIELVHPGRNHADDMTVVLFPRQGLLFSADFLADALVRESMLSLPSACGPFDGHPLREWIASYRTVEAMGFSLLSTGHGNPLTFSKDEVTRTREYFEYLQQEVSHAIEQGMNLEQMQASILLEPYQDWAQYERLREKNIEAAYNNLMLYGL